MYMFLYPSNCILYFMYTCGLLSEITPILYDYSMTDKTVKPYSVYKTYLVFFALIDGLFNIVFKVSSHHALPPFI